MKRCLLLFAMLGWVCYSFCQGNDSLTQLRDSYLLKSKHEKTAGTILLVGGLASTLIGGLAEISQAANQITGSTTVHPKAGGAFLTIGILSILTSIPVFIVGGTHKYRSESLSIDMQKANVLLPASRISAILQPALTFTIDLLKRKQRD